MNHCTPQPSLPAALRAFLGLCIALCCAAVAAGQADHRVHCAECVEDVVIETAAGQWLGGYIYWDRPPFRYLDLRRPGDRVRLSRHGGLGIESRSGVAHLRWWPHAVAMSRSKVTAHVGQPAPAPLPTLSADLDEVALLVGDGERLPLDSVRRIMPRIGSGLPAVRVTEARLTALAEHHLPFLESKHGECLGCPMTVEDVTIVLTSGEWVSGVTTWHSVQRLQGYDVRVGSELPEDAWAFRQVLDRGFEVWQAVSGPRRRFVSQGSTDLQGRWVAARGFHRPPAMALLLGAPRRVDAEEVAFVLPGPSRSSYPLLTTRRLAERLLLADPAVVMESHWDLGYMSCFGYGEVTLRQLAEVCSARRVEEPSFLTDMAMPGRRLLLSPTRRRDISTSDPLPDLIVLAFDAGT